MDGTASDAPGHLPALDGLRAVAVIAVVLFHADLAMFRGGWLGVDLFIVLSGWLITGILIRELSATGTLAYADFLGRRVRRLVPAVALLCAGVGILSMTAIVVLPSGSVLAAATWTSNWYSLLSPSGYWVQAAGPAPLDHLWSLAVEEQFYIVWPLVVLVVARCTSRARPEQRGRAVRAVAATGAAMSACLGVWGTSRGWSLDRMYLGTDTRSVGFLLGASCAGIHAVSAPALRRFLRVAGPLCAAGLTAAVVRFGSSPTMFGGAVQAADVACVVVVLWSAGQLRGPLVSAPLRALGRLSYGIYLWHWPFMVIAERHVSNGWVRAAIVMATSSAAAALSYRLVEQPLRRRSWLRGPRLLGLPRIAVIAPSLIVLAVPAIIGATRVTDSPLTFRFDATALDSAAAAGRSAAAPVTGAAVTAPTPARPAQPDPEPLPECRTIIHLGDSNLGMVMPLFTEAYRAAGVEAQIDFANGRGAFRSHDSEQGGAVAAVTSFRSTTVGPRCWVIHLGLQDAADSLASGTRPSHAIDAILQAVGDDPTLWVAPALHGDAPFTHEAAARFTAALGATIERHDNVGMIDWPALADPRVDEFQPDGIHYTTDLYLTLVETVMVAIRWNWTLLTGDGPVP